MRTERAALVIIGVSVHAADGLQHLGTRARLAFTLAAALSQVTIAVLQTVRGSDAGIVHTDLVRSTIRILTTTIIPAGAAVCGSDAGTVGEAAVIVRDRINTAHRLKTTIAFASTRTVELVGAVFTIWVSIAQHGVLIADAVTTIDDIFGTRLRACPALGLCTTTRQVNRASEAISDANGLSGRTLHINAPPNAGIIHGRITIIVGIVYTALTVWTRDAIRTTTYILTLTIGGTSIAIFKISIVAGLGRDHSAIATDGLELTLG